MKLPLTPFSKLEYERIYQLHKFIERGKSMAFLRRKKQNRINSGNKYKFGLITKDKKYYWFFYGKCTCRDRVKSIAIYNALLKHCADLDLGEPFVFKE